MACDTSFERYFWKKNDGIGKRGYLWYWYHFLALLRSSGAPFYTHFSFHSHKGMWPHLTGISEKNDGVGKKRKLMKLISVFGSFRVLRAPLYTHFFTHWNSGLWHFIWKVLLKKKQWVDKRGNPWYWYQFLTLLGHTNRKKIFSIAWKRP